MKITGIKTHIFSSQHRNAKRNWLLIRLTTDEGVEGYGEASMLGYATQAGDTRAPTWPISKNNPNRQDRYAFFRDLSWRNWFGGEIAFGLEFMMTRFEKARFKAGWGEYDEGQPVVEL